MDALTYNDMLSAYSTYPAPIRPYLLRAETHPFLRSLFAKKSMRVFIDVLARAPIKDPLRPIMLSVQNTENKLGVSARTIGRTLNILRERGWLRRSAGTDGRDNWGQFNTGHFVLGDELRSMLGLPTSFADSREASTENASTNHNVEAEDVVPTESTEADSEPSEYLSDESYYEESEQVLEASEDEYEHVDNCASEDADKTENKDNGQKCPTATNRVNKIFKKEASLRNEASQIKTEDQAKQPKIPKDLMQLQADLGIHPFGICKLMAIAKAANQRLQDVWVAKRDQILNAGAREGRAVRYFEFLLGCGEDFSYAAKQKMIGISVAKLTPQKPASTPVDVRVYWNKRFIGDQGVRVQVHGDGSGEISDLRRTNAYITPADMRHIYEAIQAGKLRLVDD